MQDLSEMLIRENALPQEQIRYVQARQTIKYQYWTHSTDGKSALNLIKLKWVRSMSIFNGMLRSLSLNVANFLVGSDNAAKGDGGGSEGDRQWGEREKKTGKQNTTMMMSSKYTQMTTGTKGK